MNFLMSLSLLLAPPPTASLPTTDTTGLGPLQGYYCNERFHFCADFPTGTLPYQSDFHDGDGIVLQNEARTATVTVAGYPGFSGKNTKEIHQAQLAQLNTTGARPMLLNYLFGEDFYECIFLLDHKQYYQQAYLFDGYLVQLSIEVPINQPLLLHNLRSVIGLAFPPAANTDADKIGSRR